MILLKRLTIMATVLSVLVAPSSTWGEEPMELTIDHVMFPIYYNNALLEFVEHNWNSRKLSKVHSQSQNDSFKGVYLPSKSFYVEYLSTVETEPYWSSAIYVVLPNEYWDAYKKPALRTDHFLIPSFGSGYQLVSPSYPHLNTIVSKDESYDGLTILISKALEQELLSIGGKKWVLPKNGKVRVHEDLHHLHDIAVIDEQNKIVAPIFEANPILREYF